MDQGEVVEHVALRAGSAGCPIVVGISGFCGSGKSTLAHRMVEALPGAVRMRGDDFLDPARSHLRSADWDGVDRQRLVSSVLEPFRGEQQGEFRRYDWAVGALGAPEPVPRAEILVVDLIGLFHPEALPSLDVTVWCDVELDVAVGRGMARDRELGRRHEALWTDVWAPNDRDFAQEFLPRERAETLYASSDSGIGQRFTEVT
ncbi:MULTISPECIES: uridine kinase family protein [unclassified Frigoribacterium]|uniref:uridine kinase family protein n=1 Tax=unclassified Frigoribacterium TaxID=2627005 RepID=UPI0006F2038D|nr:MULTISPECIES: hypothetical protein [unclassified Frigoribacterium]KQM23416.1 phosphoglycerate transporter [Frigoribacterium sp. Leaf8]WAC51600.1 phosphoglycerate transporter [Frigoribacterium sp. SL97]